jgi:hypothetical protein
MLQTKEMSSSHPQKKIKVSKRHLLILRSYSAVGNFIKKILDMYSNNNSKQQTSDFGMGKLNLNPQAGFANPNPGFNMYGNQNAGYGQNTFGYMGNMGGMGNMGNMGGMGNIGWNNPQMQRQPNPNNFYQQPQPQMNMNMNSMNFPTTWNSVPTPTPTFNLNSSTKPSFNNDVQ